MKQTTPVFDVRGIMRSNKLKNEFHKIKIRAHKRYEI